MPVIWRCHVGIDTPSDLSRRAWSFLRPYVEPADAYVFSRKAFVWEGLDDDKIYADRPGRSTPSRPRTRSSTAETVKAILRGRRALRGRPRDGDADVHARGRHARRA